MKDNLEDAFAKADEQLNNEQDEVVAEVQEPTTQEVEKPVEQSEETFTKVNIDELPEELKPVYKSLQADYTRKTQELARIRKEQEAQRQQPQEDRELTPEELFDQRVDQRLEQKKTQEFRTTAIKDYESTDPRLKMDSDTYDKPTDLYVGQEMDQRLKDHLQSGEPEYSFDYKSALKEVIQEWDSYVINKNKQFLATQQQQAKEKSKGIAKSNPRGKQMIAKPKVTSLDEAIELATK
jgi:hypothetical protein